MVGGGVSGVSGQLADQARLPAVAIGVPRVTAQCVRKRAQPKVRRQPGVLGQRKRERTQVAAGKLRFERRFSLAPARERTAPSHLPGS